MFNLPNKITITQEHVDKFLDERKARTGLTHCCPIHQALRPYMKQSSEVQSFEVGIGWIDIYLTEEASEPYGRRVLPLNYQAREFIRSIDQSYGSDMQFPLEIDLF